MMMETIRNLWSFIQRVIPVRSIRVPLTQTEYSSRNYIHVNVGGGSKGDKVQTGTLKSFYIAALTFEFVRKSSLKSWMTSQVHMSQGLLPGLNTGCAEQSEFSLWLTYLPRSVQITNPNHLKISLVLLIDSYILRFLNVLFAITELLVYRGGSVLNK